MTPPSTGPRALVYALGHAGAGAAPWRAVARHLDPDIEVRALCLPGRERRFAEPLLRTVDDQVSDLLAAPAVTGAPPQVPTVLVGICSGAITMFEMCRQLCNCSAPPARLVVASQRAPSIVAAAATAEHTLPEGEFRAMIARNEFLPPEMVRADDAFGVFEPILRADLEALETYSDGDQRPIDVPIVGVHGTDDALLSCEDIDEWRQVTRCEFSSLSVAGGHNVLTANPRGLAESLDRLVRETVDNREGQAR